MASQAPRTPFEYEIRVTWADCDPAQIVYTARIPWFALDAINAWWEAHAGVDFFTLEFDVGFNTPFVRMEVDLRAPVTPRRRLICRVWPNRLGETSVGFHVEGLQDGALCFEGDFVCVFVVAKEFRKCPPPERLRAIVEAHLVNNA